MFPALLRRVSFPALLLALGCGAGARSASAPRPERNASSAAPDLPPCAPPPLVADVALGKDHTCALTRDGAVYCWGSGENGATADPARLDRSTPRLVLPPGSALQIAAGSQHTCIVRPDKRVACWGAGKAGQLGILEPAQAVLTPTTTDGIDNVDALFAGGDRTCARSGGEFLCWGGLGGQVGDESEWPGSEIPREQPDIPADARTLALGRAHGCALTVAGKLFCWGSGARQQKPGRVSGEVSGVTVSGDTTCFSAGSTVRCTGPGWLGSPRGETRLQRVDRANIELRELERVALGAGWACATTREGVPTCWGLVEKLFGDGVFEPTVVPGHARPVEQLRVGDGHACMLSSGELRCFGSNFDGELGNGHVSRYLLPQRVAGVAGAVAVANASSFNCAVIGADRHAVCWGELPGAAPAAKHSATPVAGLSGVRQLDGGRDFACALSAERSVTCWGANEHGQLGQKDREPRSGLQTVPLGDVTKLAVDGEQACALAKDGAVHCWGSHRDYQDSNVTRAVTSAKDISLGDETLCYLNSAGAGRCLSPGASEENAWTLPGKAFESIHVFNKAVCALTVDKALQCYSLEDEHERLDSELPVLGGVAQVQGRCLIDRERQLTCRQYYSWDPISELEHVVAADTSCAVLGDRSVACWGSNDSGQVDGAAGRYQTAVGSVVWPLVPKDGG